MDVNSVPPRSRPKNRIGGAHAPDHNLKVMLPDGRLLRVIARSVLLVMAIISFPWLGYIVGSSDADYHVNVVARSAIDDYFFLPMLFGDLSNEGLVRSGGRALFIGDGLRRTPIFEEMKMDLVSEFDGQLQRSIADDTFDFVYADRFAATANFINRVLKPGGVAAVRMNGDASEDFWVPPNYKIVYLRRFGATVVAMQKMGQAALQSPTKRPLCGVASDARKAAMSDLEDVLLEPPQLNLVELQLNSVELDQSVERTKYLPDLMGDSLEGYLRRVFIDVRLPGGGCGTRWFEQHYPTRSQVFEIYQVEAEVESGTEAAAPIVRMSNWLERNVREEEYVVVKAEVDVVEEMVKSKAICLVDELFLECKHQGQLGSKGNASKRAYWECLALLGQLRDEGIAVHQWWG